MAITLTATVATSPAGVPVVSLVPVWTTAPVPATVSIVRVDPDGARRAVRQADPVALTAGVTAQPILDYEAPFDRPVSYVMVRPDGTEQASVGTVTLTAGGPWLVHGGLPELSMPLDDRALAVVNEWPAWSRGVDRGVFRVIGRAAPVVVTGRRQAPSGKLVVTTLSETSRASMLRILADGTPLLLKGTAGDETGLPAWCSVGDVDEQPLRSDGTVRSLVEWTLQLDVVDAPTGNALAAVTYNDSSASFASYRDARTVAPTYAARTGGAWRASV